DEDLGQRRQQLGPIRRHHVVVGRRNRRRDRDLEFHLRRNEASLLQAIEQAPRFHRHIGVAGLERLGIGRGARLDAKARNLAHDLAVPLGELERRNVGGKLDRRVVGEHVLQEANPRLANAGLAVRQTNEVRPDRSHYRAEHGLGVGQRDTTDEMYDRMLAVGEFQSEILQMKPKPVSMFAFSRPSCKTDARYTLLLYTTGSGIYMPKPGKPHSSKRVAYYRVSTDRQGKSG